MDDQVTSLILTKNSFVLQISRQRVKSHMSR